MFTQLNNVFKPFGQGVVAEDSDRDDPVIRVWPMEIIPTLIGDVGTASEERKAKGIGSDNKLSPYAVSIKQSADIGALWKGETNRPTHPNVMAGETVTLYRVEGTEQIFWESNGRCDNLRRLETVSYAFNCNPDKTDAKPSEGNSIIVTYSGHDKHITITTPKDKLNGEKVAYTFQMDYGSGKYVVEDDMDNHIFIDSTEHLIEFQNTDKSFIQLNKKVINFFAKDTINLETTEYNIQCETMNIKATTINTEATTINYSASNYNIKATTKHTGNATFIGSVAISGGLSVGKGAKSARAGGGPNSISNGLSIDGNLDVTGDINVPNINCDTINNIPRADYLKDT